METDILTIPDGCYVKLPSFKVQPKSSLVFEDSLKPYKWHLPSLVALNESVDLGALEVELKKMSTKTLPPADFHELLNKHRYATSHSWRHGQNLLLWICIFICIALTFGVCCCYGRSAYRAYKKISRRTNDEGTNGDDGGENGTQGGQ